MHANAPRLTAALLACLAIAGCGGGDDGDGVDAGAGAPVVFVRYQSESGGEGFEESARRDAVIVLQGFWRHEEIDAIRAANPDCKILIYQNLSRTGVPDDQGRYNSAVSRAEAQEHGWDSDVDDSQEPWLKFVEPNDAGAYGGFALQRMTAKLEESEAAGRPVDGIFLDDVNSFAPEVGGGDPTSTAEEWDAWMEEVNSIVGPGLQERGYDVMANLSGAMAQRNLESGGWEERQFEHFTYVFDEFVAWWPDGAPQPPRYVDEAFRLAGEAHKAGAVYVGSVPDLDDEAKATFGLAILLVQAPGRSGKAPGRGDGEPWYPVYDRARALGAATGEPEEVDEGVWEREFENGSVRLDLNARTAEVAGEPG